MHAMKLYREVELQIHIFLTSLLGGGAWSGSRPSLFILGEHLKYSYSGWVGPRASTDILDKRKSKNDFSGVQPVV
jgi:hypothetical protein